MNTPITKKVQDAMGARAAAAAGKQTKKAGTKGPGSVMSTLREIDANVNANIAKAATKPAVKEGSMQEFVEYGPGPAIRRGIESGKKAFGKLTGSTYGTSL